MRPTDQISRPTVFLKTLASTHFPLGEGMLVKLLLVLVSINTTASQLLLKKGVTQLGGIRTIADFPRFMVLAVSSPWIVLSVCLQIVGYLMWFLVVTREKLGIAVAFTGASFYIFMAFSAWYFYGETLTVLQSTGIALIIVGVICVALPIT
jgi:drug/metabolite transporter (DMT)-like permease